MTLMIELEDDQEAALKAKAVAQGLSTEEYVKQILYRDLEPENPEPFWKSFTRQMHALPEEVFDKLPVDGASEHDHYLYGSPKRNEQ